MAIISWASEGKAFVNALLSVTCVGENWTFWEKREISIAARHIQISIQFFFISQIEGLPASIKSCHIMLNKINSLCIPFSASRHLYKILKTGNRTGQKNLLFAILPIIFIKLSKNIFPFQKLSLLLNCCRSCYVQMNWKWFGLWWFRQVYSLPPQ